MQGWVARTFTSFIDIPDKISMSIYFSGCSIRCKNCHNKAIWDKESGILMKDDELLKKIKSNALSEYVVFLGGEPTDQLDFLIHMCKRVKNEVKKPVAIYTGREFEVLPEELLDNICIVVCGPYREDLHQDGWPASSNQRLFRKKGNIWKN